MFEWAWSSTAMNAILLTTGFWFSLWFVMLCIGWIRVGRNPDAMSGIFRKKYYKYPLGDMICTRANDLAPHGRDQMSEWDDPKTEAEAVLDQRIAEELIKQGFLDE
jgi:hypothetical protein